MRETERKAAIMIQKWYRREKSRFNRSKDRAKSKQKFRVENYFLRDKSVKNGLREMRLIMKVQLAWNENLRYPDTDKPQSVIFKIRDIDPKDRKKSRTVYKVEHPLSVFGFLSKNHPTRE